MTTSTSSSTTSAPKRTSTRGPSRKREPQDAVAVLRADHRTVEGLFTRFEKAGPRALRTKRSLVDRMVTELTVHAAIEEAVLYPAARAEVPGAGPEVLESLEEHHVVKWLLAELDGLDPEDERFDAKVAVLTENVRHHVAEEEGELFPALRTHLTRARLVELGKELRAMRSHVPTRPHPRTPDTPPASLVPDVVTHVLDRARDMVHADRP